jgi:hypothetical protein
MRIASQTIRRRETRLATAAEAVYAVTGHQQQCAADGVTIAKRPRGLPRPVPVDQPAGFGATQRAETLVWQGVITDALLPRRPDDLVEE